MKRFINRLICQIIAHNWTCKANEGIAPTKQQLSSGMDGFKDYARMYCKRCGLIYHHGK